MSHIFRSVISFFTQTAAKVRHTLVGDSFPGHSAINPLQYEWFHLSFLHRRTGKCLCLSRLMVSVSSQIPAWTTTARRAKCARSTRATPPCVCARTPPPAPLPRESSSMWVWKPNISLSFALKLEPWYQYICGKYRLIISADWFQFQFKAEALISIFTKNAPSSYNTADKKLRAVRTHLTFSFSGLWHRQQDLRHLLPLLRHQVHLGGNQEGPQAAPRLHRSLQRWALTLRFRCLVGDSRQTLSSVCKQGDSSAPDSARKCFRWRWSLKMKWTVQL